ncbi:MAG: transcriptional repressor [Gammaproteobacteria bacterium]
MSNYKYSKAKPIPVMQAHDHNACLGRTMLAAEKICRARNIRLTPLRKNILELICSSHKAIGAYDLLDAFRRYDAKAKPVTIYRTLDFLIEAGLVHKVESLNAYIGCLQAETEHHSAILICDSCHNAFEIEAESTFQYLFQISENMKFKPKRLMLELHGLCLSCSGQ